MVPMVNARNKKRDNQKVHSLGNTEIESELNNMILETSLKVVAGVISESEVYKLSKLVFRVSRGKVATYTHPVGKIYTDFTGGNGGENMAVYMLVF